MVGNGYECNTFSFHNLLVCMCDVLLERLCSAGVRVGQKEGSSVLGPRQARFGMHSCGGWRVTSAGSSGSGPGHVCRAGSTEGKERWSGAASQQSSCKTVLTWMLLQLLLTAEARAPDTLRPAGSIHGPDGRPAPAHVQGDPAQLGAHRVPAHGGAGGPHPGTALPSTNRVLLSGGGAASSICCCAPSCLLCIRRNLLCTCAGEVPPIL